MKKRLVAFLLVLIMVLGMLPVSAFAADDGVSPQALESNETQTIKYQILYVGDEFNTGYNYGVSVNKTYICQYSTGHSGFNHSILISEFRNVGVPALKGQLDSGYEFVGWAKEAKKNPTIFDFNTAGTTATQTTYTIYLVAKKTNPTPTYMYYLYYKYNDGTDSTWLTEVTDRPTAATTFTFYVNGAKLTRRGYDHIGWADKADAVTAKYTGGNPIVLTKDNPKKTIYAIWMPFFELKYDANGGTGAPASQTHTAGHPTVNRVTFTVPGTIPTKDGCTFKGWADSATATDAQYQPGDTVDVKHENSPKTVYAVWEGSDPIPVPSYDDLKSAIGQIQVKDVSTPSCGTENYDLIDNTQSEPFNWTKTARLDQPGKYDVTIKTAPYVAKYNSEKSKTHELNNANQTTLNLVISYENNKWVLDDGLRVIEVKHSEQTPPTDKPDKPTKNDVTGVVVDIVCVTTTGTHDTVQYPLGHPTDAQHTIGEVVSDGAGGYICPVTVRTAWFVQQASNLVWKVQHTPTAQTITFNLTYDKNSKTWVKPAANPRIEATHEVTPPTKPALNEGSPVCVQCEKTNSIHVQNGKDYARMYFGVSDSTRYTEVLKDGKNVWKDDNGVWTYQIKLKKDKYIEAFNTTPLINSEHTDLYPDQDAYVTWKRDGNQWKIVPVSPNQSGIGAVINVTCKLKAPTADELKKLDMAVQVKCVVDAAQQHTSAYGLLGEYDKDYFVGEPKKVGDDWLCDISYDPDPYVAAFNKAFPTPKHIQNDEKIVPVTLIWVGGSWQIKTQGRVLVTEVYTVTFDSYGGTPVPPAQEVEYGLTATKPADPTLKGYTFAFWYLGEDEQNATAYDFNTPVTENITLTAKWNINKYTVTFDSYGGTPVPPAQEVEYGLTATKPADPTLKGYTFAFWYLGEDEQNATAYDFDTPVTENITLTAKWNINKYTVAFNTDGGTPVPPAQEVEYGLTATEPAAPEKTGYTFDGWYLGDEKYDFSAAVEQNITLTAKWEKKTYKVVAKLYVNGKPAYYQNTDFYTYEVSGSYGEDIDFDTIKAKAVAQAKQIKKASASYTAVILEDHEPNPVCTTFGEHQPGQAAHYVKVNVKTEENVVILQSFAGKTDLTTLHTTTAPYGTNVVDFLNGLGLDLDVAGYTLDTDEDGNTNWYKKDSPKWTFGANDTINGWTNVLLKYTITPHNIYAYLRTGDSIGDVLELNEATLNRLGLTKYNTKGFISIGKFVSNTLLTQDEYYGFDEDEAFLDVLAELQTKLVPETDVSLDKVGSKINWSWLYQPSDVDDRIAGYPTEDTDGYQLSGSLLLYGAKFEAGANDVTGMPTAAYGAYLDYFVSGESFNLPAAPTRPGYDFKGWKIGNAVLTAGAAYTVDEDDMVFTAQWEARTDTPYTVEHYLENLDGSYALDTTEPLKGTTDTTVTAAAKSYDNFTYDSTVPGTVASGNIAGDGSLVLKLFYTRNTYDYTVRHIKQLPDGSYDEANAEVETLSGKFEALAAVTAKDYGSHYPTNDADTKQNIKIEEGLTIDVKYDLDEHTLTFETNGGSAINPVTVRHGNAVARPADPTKDKYTFIGWYADPEFTEEYDFATVLEADKTIYAKFELTSTPIGDIYVRYDVLHIKQLPDGTYDLANAEVEHLSAKKDTTVTAVIKDYRATHHVNVNRTLSKLTGTAIQPYKGVDGKPVYTILSVYYDLDFHTLTFDTMGGSKIAPETVRHGLTVAKPKDPVNGGYIFDGWYTDKTFRHRYDFSTPLTEDITIYAKWFLIVLPGVTVKKNTPKLNTADHFAYVQGYPDGTVKPAGNITRAETAAILFRLMDDASRKTYYSTKSGFRDVASGSWYNTYVATLNNAGVITDSSNGCFRPNEAITRAELAAMLAKFSETTGAANYFNDVSAKYWAANAIAICAKLGWITGYPDGTFRPDKNVTRAELMAMINRATGRAPKSADAFLPGMKTWIDNTSDKWYYLDVQEATNSHSYTVKGSETWTALTSDPNWSLYE